MPINQWKDRRGRVKIYVSRQWPDGSRFRRVQPNMTVARKTLARIEEAVAMGTWRDLRNELSRNPQLSRNRLTVEAISERYLNYCATRNRDLDFKKRHVKVLRQVLGNRRLEELTLEDLDLFVARRLKAVSPATVNRSLAVLRHLLRFAAKRGYVERNPVSGLEMLPEDEKPIRIMTLDEYRNLVDHVRQEDLTIGVYVALLGETALRKAEGLRLKRDDIDWAGQRLTVRESKGRRPRHVPLSQFAVEQLSSLVTYLHSPYLFVRPATGNPWRDPRGPFEEGKRRAGLTWVKGFHDLRHFRATEWLINGMDIRTIQAFLGHSTVRTTEQYVHYLQSHAVEVFERAQLREQQKLAGR